MGRTLIPSQMVAGLAALLAFCFGSTAIVWKWPESSEWVLGIGLATVAVFLFFVYRAARKADPPAAEK